MPDDKIVIQWADRPDESIDRPVKRQPWQRFTAHITKHKSHTVVCRGDEHRIDIWQEGHEQLGDIIVAALNEAEERGEL